MLSRMQGFSSLPRFLLCLNHAAGIASRQDSQPGIYVNMPGRKKKLMRECVFFAN